MNSSSNKDTKINNRLKALVLGPTLLGVIFCIVGIILLCNNVTYDGYDIVHDYTNCTSDVEGEEPKQCKVVLKETGECFCYIPISITKPMKAPVTLFYELDSYEKLISSYLHSRDDKQLSGDLTAAPSSSCGSYAYANTTEGLKPIAPCGQLADAMFNDSFTLQTDNKYVSNFRYGLIPQDDKAQFHNPPFPKTSNLSQAFKGYVKPKNWRQNVWELDTRNETNNGFQNERFIIWMKTDLKRKPFWRVNHTGIYEQGVPVANYTLRVTYAYPVSSYDGTRRVIISSVHEKFNSRRHKTGIALVVIGVICFIFVGAILFLNRSIIRQLIHK